MALSPADLEPLLRALVAGEIASKEELHDAKIGLCRSGRLARIPTDADLLGAVPGPLRARLEPVLRQKPARTASGVAVVSAMTMPFVCPHGACVYCPGGPGRGTPQSYLGKEPAAMRAARHGYDPYDQTSARVEALRAAGHPTDKVDLIILGGTFTGLPPAYREAFVKGCFDGLNGFVSPSLGASHAANEDGDARCVGLTIETKPERFPADEVAHSMGLGVTRVEFGVQSTFDDILLRANRGHTVEDVRAATRRAKDAGLKVGYHMMPGLPGSDAERDFASFRAIFEDPTFRPDLLKIYPTVVVPGTALHALWRRGEYEAMTTEDVVRLLVRVKPIVPPWVRIQRIQREIAVGHTSAGLDVGNVREVVRRRLAAAGRSCRCVRCREVGMRRRRFSEDEVGPRREDYDAAGGREAFLSLVASDDALVAYARLRSCAEGAFLRELRVVGHAVPLRSEARSEWQHRGFGSRLMDDCVHAARDWGHGRLRVTSGVGVRAYYRRYAERRGHALVRDGPYVTLAL